MKKPSVTELISLLDKPALLNWANKIGLEGIKLEDYRKRSLQNGTSIHKQIEDFINNNHPFENKEHENNFKRYFNNKEILEIEKPIETDLFVGRLDVKFKYNNKVYICDFKTNQKNVYFENILQLCSYWMAEKCDGVGIISVPDFRFIHVSVENFNEYEKIIKSLNTIYTLKQKLYGN
jgi:hypothetical protein